LHGCEEEGKKRYVKRSVGKRKGKRGREKKASTRWRRRGKK